MQTSTPNPDDINDWLEAFADQAMERRTTAADPAHRELFDIVNLAARFAAGVLDEDTNKQYLQARLVELRRTLDHVENCYGIS